MTSKPAGEIHFLPGKTSARLVARGLKIILCAAPIGPLFAFESRFGQAYGACLLGIGVCVPLVGLTVAGWGYRKREREVERGYTSWASTLRDNPAIVAIDADTFQIVPTPRRDKNRH